MPTGIDVGKVKTMQAAHTRRYVLTGSMLAAVAIAVLITLTIVVTSSQTGAGRTSERTLAVPQTANPFDQVAFLEMNTLQIPYSGPQVRSAEEVMLWESNTLLVPYSAPVQSSADIAFREANTLQIPYSPPALNHEEVAFWEVNTYQIPYSAPARPFGTLTEE